MDDWKKLIKRTLLIFDNQISVWFETRTDLKIITENDTPQTISKWILRKNSLVHKITTFSGFLKLPRGGGPRSWTNEGKKNPSLRDFRSNFWLSKRSASKINCHWTFLRIEMQTRFLVFWNMPEALKRLKIESKAIPERSLKCIIA